MNVPFISWEIKKPPLTNRQHRFDGMQVINSIDVTAPILPKNDQFRLRLTNTLLHHIIINFYNLPQPITVCPPLAKPFASARPIPDVTPVITTVTVGGCELEVSWWVTWDVSTLVRRSALDSSEFFPSFIFWNTSQTVPSIHVSGERDDMVSTLLSGCTCDAQALSCRACVDVIAMLKKVTIVTRM